MQGIIPYCSTPHFLQPEVDLWSNYGLPAPALNCVITLALSVKENFILPKNFIPEVATAENIFFALDTGDLDQTLTRTR